MFEIPSTDGRIEEILAILIIKNVKPCNIILHTVGQQLWENKKFLRGLVRTFFFTKPQLG